MKNSEKNISNTIQGMWKGSEVWGWGWRWDGGDGVYTPMWSGYLKGGWGMHVFLIESKRLIDTMQYFALAWN